jgi:hypothetical protein
LAITQKEILTHAALDIAELYQIPKRSVPKIRVIPTHKSSQGWINYWVDNQGNTTAIGDIHIVMDEGGRVALETLCHEMWHLKQALSNRHKITHDSFLSGHKIDFAKKMEALQTVHERDYSTESIYREAEAFYMQEVTKTHPKLAKWFLLIGK